MSPHLGQAAFRLAMFLVVGSLALLLVVRPGTAEFAITLVTLGIGLVFAAVVILLVRLLGR